MIYSKDKPIDFYSINAYFWVLNIRRGSSIPTNRFGSEM